VIQLELFSESYDGYCEDCNDDHSLSDIARWKKVQVPAKVTLKKYGLLEFDWLTYAYHQGWVCSICCKLPPSGRLHIDHRTRQGLEKTPTRTAQALC
jgi:hypothetical protein